MNSPASLFVIVFTVVNIVACLWLLWWTARMRVATPTDEAGAKTGHVWDGDLEEYNNPLPRWWLGLFVITVLFGAFYLALFPGLGNFAGTRGWTQVGQLEADLEKSRARFDERLAAFKDYSLERLATDPTAMSTAANLFAANCSTCHGSDARGARGFPNLTDSDWLWGGSPETIQETVANGRHGIMPPLGGALGAEGVNEVASYVLSLSGVNAPPEWVEAGQVRFATLCAACHGPDARGNATLGAPNLTDKVWLHGGDFASVHTSISKGRDNQMPAHREMLGDAKVRLLAAYVLRLGAEANATVEPHSPEQVAAAAQANEH